MHVINHYYFIILMCSGVYLQQHDLDNVDCFSFDCDKNNIGINVDKCCKQNRAVCCELTNILTKLSKPKDFNGEKPVTDDGLQSNLNTTNTSIAFTLGIAAIIGTIVGTILLVVGCYLLYRYYCRCFYSYPRYRYCGNYYRHARGTTGRICNHQPTLVSLPLRSDTHSSHVRITITDNGVSSFLYSCTEEQRKDDQVDAPPNYDEINAMSIPVSSTPTGVVLDQPPSYDESKSL